MLKYFIILTIIILLWIMFLFRLEKVTGEEQVTDADHYGINVEIIEANMIDSFSLWYEYDGCYQGNGQTCKEFKMTATVLPYTVNN